MPREKTIGSRMREIRTYGLKGGLRWGGPRSHRSAIT